MSFSRPLNVVRCLPVAAALITSALTATACTDLGEQLGLITAAPTASSTPQPTDAPTSEAAVTRTPEGTLSGPDETDPDALVITVWMPELLAPSNDTVAGQELLDQIVTFHDAEPDISVEFYPKRSRGPGSTIAYLRSAPAVAPGMLPDIALISRESLIEASREGLIVPMSDVIDPASFGEMYRVASQLGVVDDEITGLVYLMEFQHTVYRDAFFESPPNTFEIVLKSPVPYQFPAGSQQNVSLALLQQYMAAGGTLLDADGKPHLDVEPLREVLSFYADARKAGVIDTSLFQISDAAVTWAAYRDRQAGFTTTTSSLYLADRANVRAGTRTTWSPTSEGRPFALVTGWAWVMVTTDPARQAAAARLLQFLMEPAHHGQFSQAAGWLPSQRTALNVWGDTDTYLPFSNTVLNNAAPMPDPLVLAAVGPALQAALEDVLLENALPIQAATTAAQTVAPDTTP